MLDIVIPASEVAYRMEQRGMPVDEPRRAAMVTETTGRVERLNGLIASAAQEFHATRVAKVTMGVERAEAALAALDQEYGSCDQHPKYHGFAKPGKRKCERCLDLYAARGVARAKREVIVARRNKARGLVERLGAAFDPDKPDQWRAWFFSVEGLGLEPIDVTPVKKIPILDDDSIEVLWKRHPDVLPLKWRVERTHLQHRLSGPLAVKTDAAGMARFAYSLHRTGTGQTASGADDFEEDKPRASAGNAQNITDTLRQIFAARAGEVVLHGDYAQIEARIAAWNARCLPMMRAFLEGRDIHSLNAAAIYGIDPAKARTHLVRFGGALVSARYAAKRATHGWDYGMGDVKTARIYGLTTAEARRARAAYFDAWPELRVYQDEVTRRVERDRCLVNPFGRKLRFWGWAYRDGRWQTTDREAAIAFSVASVAKDIAKAVMPALDEAASEEGAALRTHTHDSFTFWAQAAGVDAVRERLTPIMEQRWPQLGEWTECGGLFWCPAEWAQGGNWAEAHEHDATCAEDCDRFNPEGLRKVA